MLIEDPQKLLLAWETFTDQPQTKGSVAEVNKTLRASFYALPPNFEKAKNHSRRYLGAPKSFGGTIWQPALMLPRPDSPVYYGPIFDNQYIDQIPGLAGIVVRSGSVLSHSAIVAREHNIPYIVDASAHFKPGEAVSF